MTSVPPRNTTSGVPTMRIDAAGLVGHQIALYSDQYPGKAIPVRVLSVQESVMLIDGSPSRASLDNLVNNSLVTIRFRHREQLISVKAAFRRSSGGRLLLQLDEELSPLMQRKFVRVAMVTTVNLAPLPKVSYGNRQLAQLRWLQTQSINFSAGGMLLSIPSYLEKSVLVLCNLTITELDFPALIIGQVRHCRQAEPGHFHTGIEFQTGEQITNLLTADRLRELPRATFEYSQEQRTKINEYLIAHDQDVVR